MTTSPSRPSASPALLLVGGANPLPSSVDIVTRAITEARRRGIRVHLTQTRAALARTAEVNALADAVSALDPDDADACERWLAGRHAEGARYDLVLGLRDGVRGVPRCAGQRAGRGTADPEQGRLPGRPRGRRVPSARGAAVRLGGRRRGVPAGVPGTLGGQTP